MNRALERGPLSVARGLYRSGQRLDPLVGSATMDGDSQVTWGMRRAHPCWSLSRQSSDGACTTMLAGLPAVQHPLPACTRGPVGPAWPGRPGRFMSSLHAASRIGEPIECSACIQ